MLLIIDNYDSFTWNLVQRIGELDASRRMEVVRNDKITVSEAEALSPSLLLLSPGPCTPQESGICRPLINHFRGRIPILGVCLSGGQRQRVAIARSLYTRPELMVFDEATSSLDSKSERAIQDTIGALRGSKTLIIVAHRLKTVEQCDLIIWLEAGKVRLVDRPEKVLCEYEESLL